MKWRLTTRLGRPLAAGTLEQMLAYLKYTAKDGEYQLVRDDVTIPTMRHQGVLYPFDQWESFSPMEEVNRMRTPPR
jgi:hypothetical protein